MRATLRFLTLALVACLTACADRAPPATPPAAAPPTVTVSVKSLPEVRELIQSHVGKVVVVDLWALW
jgi:hypothetical protein